MKKIKRKKRRISIKTILHNRTLKNIEKVISKERDRLNELMVFGNGFD